MIVTQPWWIFLVRPRRDSGGIVEEEVAVQGATSIEAEGKLRTLLPEHASFIANDCPHTPQDISSVQTTPSSTN